MKKRYLIPLNFLLGLSASHAADTPQDNDFGKQEQQKKTLKSLDADTIGVIASYWPAEMLISFEQASKECQKIARAEYVKQLAIEFHPATVSCLSMAVNHANFEGNFTLEGIIERIQKHKIENNVLYINILKNLFDMVNKKETSFSVKKIIQNVFNGLGEAFETPQLPLKCQDKEMFNTSEFCFPCHPSFSYTYELHACTENISLYSKYTLNQNIVNELKNSVEKYEQTKNIQDLSYLFYKWIQKGSFIHIINTTPNPLNCDIHLTLLRGIAEIKPTKSEKPLRNISLTHRSLALHKRLKLDDRITPKIKIQINAVDLQCNNGNIYIQNAEAVLGNWQKLNVSSSVIAGENFPALVIGFDSDKPEPIFIPLVVKQEKGNNFLFVKDVNYKVVDNDDLE